MQIYKKESLELLRQRIDLAEVLAPHLKLVRSGSSYKALCPFHEEKTPSFIIQKGEKHYHCFGCGAHGDAIAFLMSHLKMGFVESIEHLAERFQVALEKEESAEEKKGPSKLQLKTALQHACKLYHFCLLHSEEGREALAYLYKRGIDLDFIRAFQIGFAPRTPYLLMHYMKKQGIDEALLELAGLVATTQAGKKREFFSDRITFPIRDPMGNVIGFSARKYREETFGGKYINTPETPLFKKSHVLFGLSYSRQRIAKEKRAIIVEGQIDALRLIHSGFNLAVAGQGTAFGEDHVKELLHLGASHVYLALDGDDAGEEATIKIGHLFQKKGVEVSVLALPKGMDPDTLIKEQGPPAFLALIEKGSDYVTFLFRALAKKFDLNTPAGKSGAIENIVKRVKEWEHPLMVHETLRKLASIAGVPEALLGIGQEYVAPTLYVQRKENVRFSGQVDPDRILEADLLRWLFLMGEAMPHLIELTAHNITLDHFRNPVCQRLFSLYLEAYRAGQPRDLFSMAPLLTSPEEQHLLSEIMQKKVNLQKAEMGIEETIHRLLQRKWMQEREAIKMKIQSGSSSEEEVVQLAKEFDTIKKNPPTLARPT